VPTASRLAWMGAWEAGLTPSAAEARSAARLAARTSSTRYYGKEATARVPQATPEIERQRALPELKVVTRRRPRWGVAILALLFVAVLLGGAIVAPVLVSSAATGLEAKVGELESQQQDLATVASGLAAEISALSSPDRVADKAAALGLGPAQSVQYVEDGTGAKVTEGDTAVAGR
jgi:cell division protein FtsL